MLVVPHQVAMVRRGGAELDIRAEVVAAGLAELAVAARHARLNRHAVAHLQRLYFGSDLR